MQSGEVTTLLSRLSKETGTARKEVYDQLLEIVYDHLRQRAREQLSGERAASLQPTALVHEAYERMLGYRMPFNDRQHFFSVAAAAMRRVVVDQARRQRASKRGSGLPAVSLQDADGSASLGWEGDPELVLDVHRALASLRPEQVQLAELRFFAGFTLEEAAGIMGLKPETVKKRWEVVRLLLHGQLKQWRGQ